MADVNDLLGQALNTPVAPAPVVPSTAILPALAEDKKVSITAASADKMAQLATATPYQMAAGGDRGANSMSEYEQDMRYTSPSDLYAKYGDGATRMLQDRATGILDVKQDLSPTDRSASALTYDTLSSGLSGLTNALGGIAAFGTGLINKDAGTSIAKGLSDLTEWNQGMQSPELQGRNRVREAKNFLDSRDSQQLADDDVTSGNSELVAGLKRVGRDVVSSISNASDDSATFLDGTSQALGSLFAVGPVSKAIGGIGNAALSNSTKAGLAMQAELGGASAVAARLAIASGEAAPVLGAIGAIEGGGAYQQVTADIMGRSHEKLMEESPMYRGLIADGMSQDEAKTTVANRTGLISGAITAPLAAATGTLVSKFEGSPFAAKSMTEVVGNLLKEPIEEGIQGGTSQLVQNYAEQQNANVNKDLAEGVGRQIGEGALYGLGMTALTQAPIGAGRALQAASPFAKIAGERAKALAATAGQTITARADALDAANRAASPVADATVLQAANEATQTAPEAQATVQSAVSELPPEAQPAAQSYVDKVMSAIQFNVDEVPPSLVPVLDGSTNRVEAIQRLAEQVKSAKTPQEQLRAGLNMYDMLSPLAGVIDSDPAAIDAIPADHPASKIIQEYDAMVSAAMNTPSVRDAMAAVAQLRSQEAAPVNMEDPESVRDAVLTAEHMPDRANLDNNEKILYQVEQGNLTVTPQQKAALQASTALLRAAKAADEEAVRLGNNTKSAQVARNVRTENGEKGPSALQHTQGIMAAWKAGNTDLATERLIAFQKLVENMSNKVGALNTHLAGGDSTASPITYQALAPNGEWFESKNGLSINPVKTRSVEFAQTVAGEAKLLADVYNGLTEAFPDLGGKHFDVTSLDSKLDLPVSEVVKNFSSAPVKTPAPAAESTVAVNPAPVVAPVKTEPVSAQPSPEPVKVETTSAPKVQEIPSYTKKVWNMVVVYDAFDGMEKGDWKVFNNGFDDTFAFNYLTPAGIKIAGDFQLYGRQFLHFNITSDTGKAINSPAVLREVVKKLSERFPKVTKLHGFRISGTKGKNPETIEVVYTIKDGKVLLDRPAKATTVQEKPEPKVEAATPASVKAQLTEAKQLPFLERITAVNSLLNKENISDIVEASTELSEMVNDLLEDTQGFSDAFNKLRVRVSRHISDELRSRMMDRFDELMTVPVAQQDSGHTEEQVKFLTWLTKLADAQDKRQGDLFNMPESKVAAPEPAAEPVVADRSGYVQSIAKKVTDLPDGAKLYEPDTDTTVTVQHVVSPNSGLKQTDVIGDNGKVRFSLVENKDGSWREQGTAYLDQNIEAVATPEPTVKAAPPVNGKPKAAKADVLYPDLSTPLFNETFKIPAEQRTNIIGTEEPVNFVANVFKSQSSFVQLVGSLNYNFDAPLAKAYQSYVNTAYDLTDIMQRNLTSFMNEKGIAEMGTEAGRIIRGKALNIAEEVNGEMVYNPELVQAAALAGLQWNLTADNFGSTLDEKDLSSILGVDAESVSSAQVELMNQGLSVTEAKRTLAQKIRNYWGVTPDANAQLGNVEGIPESVAAELMRAMVETGDLTVLQLAYLNDGTLVQYSGKKPEGTVKTFDRVIPRERGEEDLLNTFPSAIEQAVLKTPEDVTYIGADVVISVAEKQLRNPLVDNTPQQLAAIENEQSTVYTLNPQMAGFYQGLGEDALVRLFGAGNLDPDNMNINHAQSAEGQNRSTLSAFKHLNGLIGQMANLAESLPLDQIPVRYAHNITRVGRLQMLGKYNPQASKMVREAMLPTWSTLDLSNKSGPDYTRFMLGVAQALGIKIHNMPAAESIKKAESMLNGPLQEVIQDLAGWVKDFDVNSLGKAQSAVPAGIADKLAQGFGNNLSFASLHAAMEYARLQNVDGKDFRTGIYVEADGMTNGPINAMALFTAGPFSPEWINNMGKGGLWFNQPGQNSTVYRSQLDSKDLYQATTDVLKDRMADLRAELVDNDPVTTKLNHLTSLMDLFLDGDLKLDTDGNLILNRGIAKNPLTITIYGSGAGGIAAKMVKAMVDKIYEAMSQVVDKKASTFDDIAVAMFGAPQSVASEKMERFVTAYSSLSNSRIKKGKKGLEVQPNPAGRKAGNFDPKTFTFRSEEIKNMQSNMLHLFVTPMRSAIEETVGKPLMDTAQLLRASTQVQSIFLETMFRQEVEAMMADKEKSDPNWKKGDFLTQKELSSIYEKLDALAPFVKTGTQTFFVAGSQSTDLGLTQFGRDFAGKFRSDAFVYGPADSGVAGIPFLNIGAGDAQMMQTAATMVDAPQRNLKIFDGMNMPLDRIYEDSEKMNQAVWESWMGNPLDAVKESYDQFMDNANFDMIADAKEALVKALFPPIVWNEDVPVDVIRTAMDTLQTKLAQSVDEIQARHNVMAMVNVSVDQMAATASPYGREGTVQLEGTDPDSIAMQLNTLYVQELAKIQQTGKPTEAISSEIEALATTHETGVKLLNSSDLNQLAQVSNMPADQAEVLKSITQSLAADGYLVAFGSAAEIAAFQQESGFVAPSNVPAGIISGYTSFGDKVIYLINPTTETLIHELVHAATFDFVNSFYNGDAGRLNPQASAAIERTEVLMEQFLNLPAADILPAAAEAHDNASSVINDYLLNGDKASALNEFMAWALSNRQLQNLTKKTKASKLAQIAQSVWEAIKSMYFRRREAPNKGTDMFSNLLFNSAILMRKQPTTAHRYKGNVLFMNSIYGDNERMAKVAETFDKTVAQYLQAPIRSGTLTSAPVVATGVINALDMATLVQGHGFVMNMQEASTFNSIVAALATEAQIDPASMVVAQELYAHVIKNLSVESFMADPTDNTQRYYAQEKYNAVSGKYGTRTDALGRTAMLSTFLALATVNEEFRKILSNMDMPKSIKNADGTLDATLENVGSGLMDKLSARLSGTSKATNVQEAVDALHDNIASLVNDRDTFIDQVASKSGGLLDRANDLVVEGVTTLANATNKTANKVAQNANNKVVRTTAQLTAAISGLIADRSGQIAAKGLMSKANMTNLWEPLHVFINDLVGRTDSNASIYDMIKGTRSVVQAARQQFRERLPELLSEKFTRLLTDGEWETLHTGLGKTDIAALLDANTNAQVIEMLGDQTKLSAEISRLEGLLTTADTVNFPLVQMKAKQLATFMNTGVPGRNLLRNAETVSKMFGEPVRNFTAKPQAYIDQLDQLISLYSLDALPTGTKEALSVLVKDQAEGTDFSLSYLKGQRYDEQAKATGVGRVNFYKGHIPTQGKEGVSLIIADDAEYADLRSKSYVRVADYENSNLDRGTKMGYYFAPVSARAAFQQGIMQNVRQTAGGVDQATGFSNMATAGRITDTGAVKAITARLKFEKGGSPLLPVYDENGRVFAYERSLDPVQMERTQDKNHLGKAIGQWRGRQFEEGMANTFNMSLVDNLHNMYEKDMAESTANSKQYVDLWNDKLDPVVQDAVKLFNPETVAYIESKFGKSFPVRKDMLNDALGYRNASVGDAWSGNTRWSDETQKTVKRMAISVFGNDAYKTLVNAEKTLRNIVSDARVLIAVKSVIVPAVNFVSNILQLTARGVPLKDMYKNMPVKTAELESYMTNRLKQVDLEAELRATQDPAKTLKLRNQVNAINDSNKRLSIWPLLEAGEFSTVADAGMTRQEIMLTTGRLQAYMEQAADKLPGPFRTLGRYALVTKDTALFKALQKSVEYSDFLAKAVLFDDLTKRQGLSNKDALGRVTEEFINYDRLPGRFRGTLENIGLLWFYNFKIRSTKVALSMIRNNPVHTLLASTLPAVVPGLMTFGAPGLPTYDNIAWKAITGTLGGSIGPGQGLRAASLNPWVNLTQ